MVRRKQAFSWSRMCLVCADCAIREKGIVAEEDGCIGVALADGLPPACVHRVDNYLVLRNLLRSIFSAFCNAPTILSLPPVMTLPSSVLSEVADFKIAFLTCV